MASKTRKTDIKRSQRKQKAGKNRKRLLRNKGTTPVFPIHIEQQKISSDVPAEQTSGDNASSKE
ncbi:hypothetical protein JW979_04740 [bacterium]|nr:hypothetical protein [candidate division CSSED10-310 bacterium]